MQNLKVSLVQIPLIWESPVENRKQIARMIKEHSEKTDVFILPEMFTTGFTMSERVTEEYSENSETVSWMKSIAKEYGSAVCGSAVMSENGNRRNRFLWVDSEQIQFYDKRHLFAYGLENENFTAGQEKVIINYKGWKILPQVCYDLRFPVFSRNQWNGDSALYDLIIYAANWPDARVHAWDVLGRARAIENQSYVALVNRVGEDRKLNYVGHSALIDANGKYIISPVEEETGIFTSELEYEKLQRFRQRFPFLEDGDGFEIKN